MLDLFSKLMSFQNKLANYIKMSTCSCEVVEKIAMLVENDNVHQFLMGLDGKLIVDTSEPNSCPRPITIY